VKLGNIKAIKLFENQTLLQTDHFF